MRTTIFILVSVLLLWPVHAETCVKPENNMHIVENTMFCKGHHEVKNMYVETPGTILDCKGATLEGQLNKQGIIIQANNVEVKNCNLVSYKKAIVVDNAAASFENVHVTQSVIGLYTLNSKVSQEGLTLIDNERDSYNDIKEVTSEKKQVPNEVSEELLNRLELSTHVTDKVEVTKELIVTDKKSTFAVTITALEDHENLVLYEHIPKELADHVDQITFSQPVTVINEDPDVMIPLGRLKVKTKFSFEYSIKKKLTGKEKMPSTVVAEKNVGEQTEAADDVEATPPQEQEEPTAPQDNNEPKKTTARFWTILFFIIAALTSAAFFFFERHHN